ncbi:MAG: peptide chain release factor N(5)-glutamine methyltransferase [Firmicutes bacterium]|nr:peptide chain release factor N(5)-glutamine methyltransferase [Bacillota bacterium]
MKLSEIFKETKRQLSALPDYMTDAGLLLLFSTGHRPEEAYVHGEREVAEDAAKKLFECIGRRLEGEPLQYITGEAAFMGLEFSVQPGVLIPRADTETLVEAVFQLAHDAKRVLEPCTGSGCIAVALAKLKGMDVDAFDISEKAIEVARRNVERHGVREKVSIFREDALNAAEIAENSYELFVSNPPYIKESEISTLMREVRDHEPHEALSGGGDGLVFYRALAGLAQRALAPGGMVFFEIGYDQREDVLRILEAKGFYGLGAEKDLGGNDRVVYGRKR